MPEPLNTSPAGPPGAPQSPLTHFPKELTGFVAALGDRYVIEREIGRGGMATVYLARDLRHDRPVALKVLKSDLAAVLGVERFLAEIKVTANLQHPNLLPLFDSGEASGLLFYVMPYVEGESLRARLDREKQLPVDEAVRVTAAVASALDYAHRHHVVHRDLKPENILLLDGQPLIADFGIALAVTNAGGERITQTGISLGTPRYMSPEQASGDRVVDGRSDIYSLGAVAYEMLAGEPPHLGNTVQAIVAKVLTERAVTVTVRRPTVPLHVAEAIDRALEKTPADRFSTGNEFADALLGKSGVGARHAPPSVRAAAARSRRELVAWAVAGLAVGAAGWALTRADASRERPVVRTRLDLPQGMRINDALVGATLAVSPGGDLLAFTSISGAGFRMYFRRTDELEPRVASDMAIAARNIAFSPDGRWVAFSEGAVVKKLSVDGGQALQVASMPFVPYGLTWVDAERIVAGTFVGLFLLPAGGGEARPVSDADVTAAIGQRWPVAVPGTDAVVYVPGSTSFSEGRVGVLRLGTGEQQLFDLPMAVPLGVLGGHLVFVSTSGVLMAVPFDVRRLRPAGNPVTLGEGIAIDATAGAKASLSASGTLAYLSGRPEIQPVLVGRDGASTVPLIREVNQYANPRYSPDGRRVALSVRMQNATHIWVYDIASNTFTRLTSEGTNVRPEWSPDGTRVVFRSERAGKSAIWWQRADGSRPAELLYEPDVDVFEALISPDGKWLLYRSGPGVKSPRDILIVPMDGGGERTPRTLVGGATSETMPRISPDGRWLAYQSNEQGRFEVYVVPFPSGGARVQVSSSGGSEAVWDRSGQSLYYRGPAGELVSVAVTTGARFSIGERRVLLSGDYLADASHANYDVAPDGRFLLLRRAGAETQTIVVHNWGRELRERTAGRGPSR